MIYIRSGGNSVTDMMVFIYIYDVNVYLIMGERYCLEMGKYFDLNLIFFSLLYGSFFFTVFLF